MIKMFFLLLFMNSFSLQSSKKFLEIEIKDFTSNHIFIKDVNLKKGSIYKQETLRNNSSKPLESRLFISYKQEHFNPLEEEDLPFSLGVKVRFQDKRSKVLEMIESNMSSIKKNPEEFVTLYIFNKEKKKEEELTIGWFIFSEPKKNLEIKSFYSYFSDDKKTNIKYEVTQESSSRTFLNKSNKERKIFYKYSIVFFDQIEEDIIYPSDRNIDDKGNLGSIYQISYPTMNYY